MTRHYKTTQTNMENTESGQFLHIEMWTKMWSSPSMEKLNKTKSSGEIFKTTVYSRLLSTKNSRSLMEKIWKIGISKMFFFLNLEIFMWFLYQNSNNVSHLCRTLQTTYHIRSINNSYIYCVAIIVKLVNSKIHIWLIWCGRRNILCNGWDEQL